jgi:hypothetical protein
LAGGENFGLGTSHGNEDFSFGLLLKIEYLLGTHFKGKAGLDPTSTIFVPGRLR